MSRSTNAPRWSDRRGNAVMVVLVLLVLFGMAALAIDLGTQHLARVQLQTGVDAAARSAALHLDRTPEGLAEVSSTAVFVAWENPVLGEPIELAPSDVTTGIWDRDTQTFTPSTEVDLVNAVRLDATVEGIPTPFAAVAFDRPLLGVSARSIAVRPRGPAAYLDCYLPIALPECTWAQIEGGDQGDHHYVFSTDQVDNVGWADPINPNSSNIRTRIDELLDGTCTDGYDPIGIGDTVVLNNGVQDANIRLIDQTLQQSTVMWDESLWGPKLPADEASLIPPGQYATTGVLQGPIAIFSHTSSCDGVRFNQAEPLVAYAWGVVFDVFRDGDRKGIQLYVDVEHEWDTPGGGGSGAGNVYTLQPPILVQ